MRCAKCHKNEASIHFTPVVDGKAQKTVHLCKDCAPTNTRIPALDPKKPEALSVTGKQCEFCGRPACSEIMVIERAVYLCLDCVREFGRIIVDLCISERPRVMERVYIHKSKKAMVIPRSLRDAPEVRAWFEVASRKAVEILRERRR